MPALKNIAKAGIGGAGAAYRHNVDPDYKGDTAIHKGMSKVPDEAWLGLSGGHNYFIALPHPRIAIPTPRGREALRTFLTLPPFL